MGTVKDHSVGIGIKNLLTVFNNAFCIWIDRLIIVVVQASCCVNHITFIDDASSRTAAFIK